MEHVYLFQVRVASTGAEPVYKIGMSKNIGKRIKQYPPDTRIISIHSCDNAKVLENKIIKLFDAKFSKAMDIGREYYRGNMYKMRDLLYEIVSSEIPYTKDLPIIPEKLSVEIQSDIVHPFMKEETCWDKFVDICDKSTITEIETMDYYFSLMLPLVLAYVEHEHGFFIRKRSRDNMLEIDNQPGFGLTRNKKFLPRALKNIKNRNYGQIYSSVIFKPMQKCSPNVFNLWLGFGSEIIKLRKDDYIILQFFLATIRTYWASDDEETYHCILSWFAQIIQKPYDKTNVALVINGVRDDIVNFIVKYVIGEHLCYILDNNCHIDTDNSFLVGKILIISENSDQHISEQYITNSTITVKEMYIDPFTIDNCLNFVTYTDGNDMGSGFTENCIHLNTRGLSKEDTSIFQEKMYTRHAGNIIYTYLKKYKSKKFVQKLS